ncbi:MAG: hypothetical protein WBV36_13810 [Terriglobales bacterium]
MLLLFTSFAGAQIARVSGKIFPPDSSIERASESGRFASKRKPGLFFLRF